MIIVNEDKVINKHDGAYLELMLISSVIIGNEDKVIDKRDGAYMELMFYYVLCL